MQAEDVEDGMTGKHHKSVLTSEVEKAADYINRSCHMRRLISIEWMTQNVLNQYDSTSMIGGQWGARESRTRYQAMQAGAM